MPALRLLAFLAGLAVVGGTLISAIRTVVLPRSAPEAITGLVFRGTRWLFDLRLRWARTYAERDAILALYAPLGLFLLPPVWLALVAAGYTLIFWALGQPWRRAFLLSGSSLLTLGFAQPEGLPELLLVFSEGTIGLVLAALLIAYLPTMYSAFSRRETAVTLLAVRAGSPPSAVELIARYHRLNRFDHLHELWESWETWFAEVEENHTSLAALVFFRSPQPDHSWVTASGAVLDAASLAASSLAVPADVSANLCIRAGYLALRRIADFFNVEYDADPRFPASPISVTRAEFDRACDQLAQAGVQLKPDRDRAWTDFAGWRVNYDAVLLALCRLTMAPEAPWSSDRMPAAIRRRAGRR